MTDWEPSPAPVRTSGREIRVRRMLTSARRLPVRTELSALMRTEGEFPTDSYFPVQILLGLF